MNHHAQLVGVVGFVVTGTVASVVWSDRSEAGILVSRSGLTALEELGKEVFFDENLSTPPGQSCATCHNPEMGWTGTDMELNYHGGIQRGAVHTRFGKRRPPTAAYAGDSPLLTYDPDTNEFYGGMLWNGRATGWDVGDPLVDQAMRPFLGALEMNNPGENQVLRKIAQAEYAHLYREAFGEAIDWRRDYEATYTNIARAIAAFERSPEVTAFTSKYDYHLAGMVELTDDELHGLMLFEDPLKGNCASCHPSRPAPDGEPPLFTTYGYANLGLPKTPTNPFYNMPPHFNPEGGCFIDRGLAEFLETTEEWAHLADENLGKQKIPTLRNVDRRPHPDFIKAFGHDGCITSIETFVHFLNTRDVEPWPEPEVSENLSYKVGNLGLTAEEEMAIVAFLKTLTDGFEL